MYTLGSKINSSKILNVFPKAIFAGLVILLIPIFSFQQKDSTKLDTLFDQIESSLNKISTMEFTLKRMERIDGEMITAVSDIKFQANPLKSLLSIKVGEKAGDMVLYIPGENEGNAIYIPNGFPYINFRLDPYGALMRKNSHYTVNEMGVTFIIEQIKGNYVKNRDKFHYRGIGDYRGSRYHKIEGLQDAIRPFKYTVKEGEDLTSIARKFVVSEYMILSMNEGIDFYDDVEAGQVIEVPDTYAKRIVLYVEPDTFFPPFVEIEDNEGVYAVYEYTNIKIDGFIDQKYFDEKWLDE